MVRGMTSGYEELKSLGWRLKKQHRFCLALITDDNGNFVLQQRDNKPSILYPNKISLFGGGAVLRETPHQCLSRELREELGIELHDEDVLLTTYVIEHCTGMGEREGYVFCYQISDVSFESANEGRVVVVERRQVCHFFDKLTPIAAYAISCALIPQSE